MITNQSTDALEVTILSPEETLYNGSANSVTCMNKEGEFDILPMHSNFISLIYKKIVIHRSNEKDTVIDMGYALLKCIGNKLTILTNVDISTYSDLLSSNK